MGQIKLTDYVVEFLKELGVTHIFAITGGASVHLIDSIAKCEGIEYICNQHEQGSAMSADGYAKQTGKIAAAIATSGPGATNLLTGCASSYLDSIPVIFITGQVNSYQLKGDMGIRSFGFQDTDVVGIFSPVTKYAVQIKRPEDIRYELEKAAAIAMDGRRGPVLVDIPLNFQYQMIEESNLRSYKHKQAERKHLSKDIARNIFNSLRESNRPLFIAGNGIRLSGAQASFKKLVEKLNIPIMLTWATNDLLETANNLRLGNMGINGSYYCNFAVQNADLIISVGARLGTHSAGAPINELAPLAKKIIVDIDEAELNKFEKLKTDVEISIQMDAKDFIDEFLNFIEENVFSEEVISKCSLWSSKLQELKKEHPAYIERKTKEGVNPYEFVKKLSKFVQNGDTVVLDTGSSLIWTCQAFEFKNEERVFSAFNNTPMGYALPASIGAAFKCDKRVICVTGDGGLQMNIQELVTVIRHNLNITIIVFVNNGYGIIQKAQDQYHNSRYEASDIASGLAFPDFSKVFNAYGFKTFEISTNVDIEGVLKEVFALNGQVAIVLKIPIDFPFIAGSPQRTFPVEV